MSLDRVLLLMTMVMMSKKSIAIFAYKQRISSIEMKSKLVQHVPRNEAVGNLLKYLEDQIFYVFFMI